MATAGQVIDGKYEILTLIGQGGMSKVYLARDRHLNKQWAVKEIQKKARDKNNEVVVQSAIAEANMIKQLDHPSIVRIVDIIDNPDMIYIIEDYIEGETLNTILEENGAQPQELVIEWAMQICEALEYLHTRKPAIIYRDMKPSNVMLKPDGNIKIIDFGIAREYKEQSLADTVSLGTKGYAAPEQFGGKGQTDARTDIYCLGVTLYHLVTGHSPCDPPYEIYPIRHWNPQLDPGLEAIIEKCTQLNPADRYQSCAELLYALQHYEENGAAYRAKQKKKLSAFIATTAACLLFAAVGGLGLVMETTTNNADYEQNILSAEKAATQEEKIAYCIKAIDIKPLELTALETGKKNPYEMMIDLYKGDGVFSMEEEKQLLNVLRSYADGSAESTKLADLKEAEGYGELAFEVGKLYWYYYGDTSQTDDEENVEGMTSAVQWFSDAADIGGQSTDYYVMATLYSKIGTFHQEIDKKVMEGSDDAEMYQGYWDTLKQMANTLANNEKESEIVKLHTYKRTLFDIEIYVNRFKNRAGISEGDVRALYEQVNAAINNTSATTEMTIKIKDSAVARLGAAETAINNAYRG